MLKLELQYFGHLMQRNDWLEKTLILGKIEGRRRRGRQRTRWLDSIIDSNGVEQTQRCGEGQGSLVCCSPWVAKSKTWVSDWTTTTNQCSSVQFSSVTQLCLTLCHLMNYSMPRLPVHHQLSEFTQTHIHWVGDDIQPSHPVHPLLLPPSIFPSIRVFSNESVLHIRWPKYWSFSFSISPSNE